MKVFFALRIRVENVIRFDTVQKLSTALNELNTPLYFFPDEDREEIVKRFLRYAKKQTKETQMEYLLKLGDENR